MRPSGVALWAGVLAFVVCVPIVRTVLSPLGIPYLVAFAEGAVVAAAMYMLYWSTRPAGMQHSAAGWGPPTLMTAAGALVIVVGLWDPTNLLDWLGVYLAGGGVLQTGIVRLGEGAFVLAGALIIWKSLRPSQATLAKRHQKRTERKLHVAKIAAKTPGK